MEILKLSIIYVLGIFVTAPIIATFVVYLLSKRRKNHTWRAIHQAVHWTFLLYVLSCIAIFYVLFNRTFISWILLLHIAILMTLIILQWKRDTHINMKRSIKLLSRISFIIFFVGYLSFALYGILSHLLFV